METPTPQFARSPKPGLLRSAPSPGNASRGTQAPGEGFALTIAERVCAKLTFDHEHDRHDVALGVALVAAKRASIVGRGPQIGDVHVAMGIFGLRDVSVVSRQLAQPFIGIAHSYVAQRRLVDAVLSDQLMVTNSTVH